MNQRMFNFILLSAFALGLLTPVALALNSIREASLAKSGRADWGGEGTLVAAPEAGPSREITRLVEPGVMSIVFSDERTAREFYDEAVSNGERVCLSDLGPQKPEFHGQRYWLFTC